MKNLLRFSAATLVLGMLGATACSSCSQPPADASSNGVMAPVSMRCGPNTHLEGTQCVGDATNKSVNTTSVKPKPIGTDN